MGHGRGDACLCADSKVVNHAVVRCEFLSVYRCKKIADVHEALVDGYLAVACVHEARAMRVVSEHGSEGGVGRLLYA